MSVLLLNRLIIVGVAVCSGREEVRETRTVLLVMNSDGDTKLKDLNRDRLDKAYTEIHRGLRAKMYEQAGGAASGSPQRLTMEDYTISFTCKQETTPIVYDPLMELMESLYDEGQGLGGV